MGGFFGHIRSAATLMVAAVTLLAAGAADARVAGLGSGGVRGLLPPALTRTAPKPTTPQPGGASESRPSTVAHNGPTTTTRTANRPGLVGGLAAGFLGAGLFGMLFGGGFLSGLAGFASILGFIAQIALIAGAGYLLFRWWQRRQQPQQALAGMPREAMNNEQPMQRSALGGFGMGGGAAAAAPVVAPLEIQGEDFDTFERMLGEIQTAYGREDLGALRPNLTPEMLSYYAEELSENASRNVVNKISDVKLEQGDLAEAWSEGDKEYASVAMRYSLVDQYVDRTTGQAADGTGQKQEATEVWTFVRSQGGKWLLSAIQQA